MHKFKGGNLHSGSANGPQVKDRAQAIAIMMSEKQKAQAGKKEYQSKGGSAPSKGKPAAKPAKAAPMDRKKGFSSIAPKPKGGSKWS